MQGHTLTKRHGGRICKKTPARTDFALCLYHLSAEGVASSCGKDVANKILIGRVVPREARQFAHINIKSFFFPESQEDYLTHIFQKEERKVRKVECATSWD